MSGGLGRVAAAPTDFPPPSTVARKDWAEFDARQAAERREYEQTLGSLSESESMELLAEFNANQASERVARARLLRQRDQTLKRRGGEKNLLQTPDGGPSVDDSPAGFGSGTAPKMGSLGESPAVVPVAPRPAKLTNLNPN